MNHTDRLWRRWTEAADLQALGQVFDRTAPSLYRLAQHLAHDSGAADDALQSTFLAALESPRDLGASGRVEAWLSGVLVRQIRRQHHERSRDRRAPASEEAIASAAAPERTPAGQVAGREVEVQMAALIDRLPAGYAEPLRRQLIGGESAQSIAQELGLSTGAVHARVSRGLKKLRKLVPASLAAPALGRGASYSASYPRGGSPMDELRARILECAGSVAGPVGGKALGAGAVGFSVSSLAFLLTACGLVAAGLLWGMADAITSETAGEPGASSDTDLSTPLAGSDGPKRAARAALEAQLSAPPAWESERRLPSEEGVAVSTRSEPNPGFDLRALAVPNALLLDENTDRPLANAICRVTDSMGVSIIAETDATGRFLTDEVLIAGRVDVSIMGAAERRRLRAVERPDRPKSYVFDQPIAEYSLHVKRGLRHSGEPTVPDRWRIGAKRWVPLECAGTHPSGTSIEVVLTASFPEPSFELRWPQPPGEEGLSESVVRVASDAYPLVVEAKQALTGTRRLGNAPLPPWSRQRVDTTVAGRMVRAVQFLDEGVLVAEAEASVVPFPYQTPLRLEFSPLGDPDPDRILSLYGEELGARIIRHLQGPTSAIDGSKSARGVVTSESGQFHGRVDVMVTTPVLEQWRGGVTWKQEASGEWVGSFAFNELSEGPHHFTVAASGFTVSPQMVEATPPAEFERGIFVVQDLHAHQPLVLSVRGPDGALAESFTAELKWGNQLIKQYAAAGTEELVLTDTFPLGMDFQIRVESSTHLDGLLTQDDFRIDGSRLVGEVTLEIDPE